jgi:hypothetical protein
MPLSCLHPLRPRRSLAKGWGLRLVLLGVILRVALLPMSLLAQGPTAEYTAKAHFLLQLPDYVKWSSSAGEPIRVGILGDDSFAGALAKLNPKRSQRIEDLKDCQMIFISKSEAAQIPAILASLDTTNILTVGETDGFAKKGGGIGLVFEEGKWGFEINPGAARRAGLGFDLRLLRLAARVINSD